ncbi:IscS subfamily cysteine desulfurase [Candidatus Pacearchaeota archaeon]|nr:IscS subfamily cysteine desulfurase [Candidatus Pacearchaeota archaeon]
MKEIYLDNAATTKVDERVLKEMEKYHSEYYGNASSIHDKGEEAKSGLEKARKIIANSINASPEEIVFTSGGTESNNLAIKGIAFSNQNKKHIITTKIEHDCVLNACKWLEKQGWKITYLEVNSEGFVDVEQLKREINENTALVSIIHGNNEIGTVQDLESIGKICREKNILFHTDACQSYTKENLDVKKQNLDLVTLNAHKIHGPKGVGALYIRNGIKITPLAHGGGQEKGKRGGTENVPGVVGFAKAVEIASEKEVGKMKKLRDKIINGIEKIRGAKLNGSREKRLCNNINFVFKGIEGEAIVGYLNEHRICCSTGSACSSKSLEPSHVLLAIGLKPEEAHGSLRISLSKYTTKKEVEKLLKVLPMIIKKLRSISPFGGN